MSETEAPAGAESETGSGSSARRKIPGNLPYTSSPGVLRRVLEKIPISEKPAVFNNDFLTTVLGVTGGSARPIIPILKATGLLNQSATPTELYAQFQTDGGRASAALQALRNGFQEIFKRNQYAHKAEEKALTDVIVAITGAPKGDSVVRYIYNTFETFKNYENTLKDEQPKSIPNNDERS